MYCMYYIIHMLLLNFYRAPIYFYFFERYYIQTILTNLKQSSVKHEIAVLKHIILQNIVFGQFSSTNYCKNFERMRGFQPRKFIPFTCT